jgi:MFS family permease
MSDNAYSLPTLHRRTLITLVVAQVVGGAGLASSVAVGVLIANELLADPQLSGLPFALTVGGTALAAVPLARLMRRSGRRVGLRLGWGAGALGATLIAVSTAAGNAWLFLAGMALFGGAGAAADAARYAASDLATNRGRAIGTVVFATTLSAVAGPLLLGPAADVAATLGAPPLAGPFLMSAAMFGAAGLLLQRFLRPDPLLIARRTPRAQPADEAAAAPAAGSALGGAIVGGLAMALASFIMILAMVATPAELDGAGAGLGAIGLMFSIHITGMFAPSPISGWLSDRFGPRLVIVLSGLTIGASGALLGVAALGADAHAGHASAASGHELLMPAMLLLGIGWNFGFIGGSTLLGASLAPDRRVPLQGWADAAMGLAGLAGAALSGLVVTHAGGSGLAAVTIAAAGGLLAAGLAAGGLRGRLTAIVRRNRALVADAPAG